MSFNWPDIPFSGTEVDAFVAEYKALAQTIYDTWYDEVGMDDHGAVSWEHLEPPYESRENVRLYLESALLYSAFVVKQRAGNSGPGTDFVLGSSPLNTPLPNPKLESLYKRLGCSFADAHLCYEEGDGTPPKFTNAPPPIEELANGGPGNAPPGEGNPGNAGNPPPPGPPYPPNEPNNCPGGNSHNGSDGSVNNGAGITVPKQAWIAVMEILKGIAYVIGIGGLWHAADMVIHFLNGTGTTYTGPNRNMKNKLRIEAHNHLRNAGQIGGPKNSRMPDFIDTNTLDFIKGPYVELPAAARATLGLSPSQKAWRMDFTGSQASGAFGRALIVSDGTETIDIHPFAPPGYDPNDSRWWIPRDSENRPNVNKITHILDDYDFNYSWTIVRSDLNNDFPGIQTPDDIQIVSGKGYCGEDGNSNRTVCGALTATGNSGKNYLQRLPVAEAHGDGCKDWDPNLSSRDGRPYTVRITF